MLATSPLYGSSTELIAEDGEQPISLLCDSGFSKVASGEATGVAVSVVHKGRLVWEEGFRFSDREKSIQVTARTPFCLASLTKSFTTTTLMTLVAMRESLWTRPGINILPEAESKARTAIRMMLRVGPRVWQPRSVGLPGR